MNLCPYFPQLLSDLGVIRYKTPARSAVERLSCMNKMCDILLVWLELHWRVCYETVLRSGSKERLGNVYFEHIVALHVGVCTQRCRGDTFS